MVDKRRKTGAQQTPETTDREGTAVPPAAMPSVERVRQELASAQSLDDFFGKEGIFARLFATTIEQMLEACHSLPYTAQTVAAILHNRRQ